MRNSSTYYEAAVKRRWATVLEKPKGKSGTGELPVRPFSGPRYRLGSETGKRKLTLRKHAVSPEQKRQITDRLVRYLEKRLDKGVKDIYACLFRCMAGGGRGRDGVDGRPMALGLTFTRKELLRVGFFPSAAAAGIACSVVKC